ncbi:MULTISPECIES: TPM domain-containing protein [Marinobacter]|uniref:TPM domain-containing protein n=1 Tax=Marinobacter xiaoshiensis TaxID=3073652 RepID=A0ABU2HK66_9GAMM|nr:MULTISPECIES: TPM domain-containing protein [unclassified Marinobacter]MBK1885091.1 TPM domain-containing protein [Marinobacter sp. DY40_1A1]MDS1311474.1 TPM domain-containing protein [Marinobacter sp. F60267]
MTLLSKQEQEQVAAAITAVERETDAEVVTVLTAQADNYAYIPLLWAGIIALLVPGIINYLTSWLSADVLLLSQWGVFALLSLVFRIPGINRRLIPRSVGYWRASNLARRQFLEQNLHHTAGATGMLIFVSEAERYVEILVDRGISERIGNDAWEDIIAAFTKQVKQGETLTGFISCIEDCGKHLKAKVPATHQKDELPNHLVILS